MTSALQCRRVALLCTVRAGGPSRLLISNRQEDVLQRVHGYSVAPGADGDQVRVNFLQHVAEVVQLIDRENVGSAATGRLPK